MIRFVKGVVAACLGTASAYGATISISYPSGDVAAIIVEGNFVLTDVEQFQQKAGNIPKAVVLFHSDGGNAIAAIEIGKFIRLHGYATAVPNHARCASACALAWLGGKPRMMGKSALVGFHAVYDATSGLESGVGNALVGAYLNTINLPTRAVYYITRTPPSSVAWLTPVDARNFGIEVTMLNPETAEARPPPTTTTRPPAQDGRLSQMERRSKVLVAYLYNTISRSDANVGDSLAGFYADTVHYYGKDMSRDQVLAQAHRLLTRWPARQYEAKTETVTATCNEIALTCTVAGVLQFDARSADRNQRSSGAATFALLLQFSSDLALPKIIAEDGSVLTRRKEALTANQEPPATVFDARIR